MQADALKRLVAGHEAAARRQTAVAPIDPHKALMEALALWDLNPECWFAPLDATRLREVAEARSAWMRLRKVTAGV